MTMELARARTVPKPWGVSDVRPWSRAESKGPLIGEIYYERTNLTGLHSSLLLKVLLTSQPLSIQVHPDDDAAHAMGLPNGKTEAWYILCADPGAAVALGLKQSMTPLQLRASILDGSIADRVAWRAVAPGDVIVVPAGTIHAIGAGLVIAEIQQRSETTFRLFDYGRNRELHVESALAAVNKGPTELQLWPDQLTNERSVLVDNPHFVFERIELPPDSSWSLHAKQETWILIVAGGASAGTFSIVAGEALFVEADRVDLGVGTNGLVALVAYVAAGGPVVELLQRVNNCRPTAVLNPPAPEPSPFIAQPKSSPVHRGTCL